MWEIVNINKVRWGRETYPTKEAAEKELRDFWRGVSGVDLKKFTIREEGIAMNNDNQHESEDERRFRPFILLLLELKESICFERENAGTALSKTGRSLSRPMQNRKDEASG
jgi:hypothetical protein